MSVPLSQDTPVAPALADNFRDAFRLHPAGVAIITADPGDQPVALTISSLISVSVVPPTVAFSLSTKSSSSGVIRKAATVVIHLLRLQDVPLAQLCATSGVDRFGPDVNWTRLATGEPLYTDVGVWFRARVINELDVPGATVVVAELLEGHVDQPDAKPEESSLVYLNRNWHGLRALLPGDSDAGSAGARGQDRPLGQQGVGSHPWHLMDRVEDESIWL